MRQSRKAGLLGAVLGVAWFKYACTGKSETVYRYKEENVPPLQFIGDASTTWSGHEYVALSFDKTNNEWYYVALGGSKQIQGSEESTYAYALVPEDRTKHLRVVSRGNGFAIYTTKVSTYSEIKHTYTVDKQRYFGHVRAARGEYPDEENGYHYVTTTDDGYIIMSKGTSLYAYSTKRSLEVPTYTFSASVNDGVLVVTGDGSATIVDDVLVTTGAGSASVENNTLYVR